jgi:hypothetical protein
MDTLTLIFYDCTQQGPDVTDVSATLHVYQCAINLY